MLPIARKEKIKEMILEKKSVTVAEPTTIFDVTEETFIYCEKAGEPAHYRRDKLHQDRCRRWEEIRSISMQHGITDVVVDQILPPAWRKVFEEYHVKVHECE